MTILGYNFLLAEKINDQLRALNSSMNELMTDSKNEELSKFKNIEFELEGLFENNSLKLVVKYTLLNDASGSKIFTSHVDSGAIEVYKDFILAYYGDEKFKKIAKRLETLDGVLDFDFLKENEPELLNQLASIYLLDSSPNTEYGSEYTDSDKEFFREICE